jgi:subfamily B ATP-binding cassette protein MsbA
MIKFLRKIWPFVRPYQSRLILGILCGVLYALTNGALIMAIKLVVNLVFSGSASISVAQELEKAPAILQPLARHLTAWVPELRTPSSSLGLVLVICTIPAVMFIRAVAGYLNIYLMSWAATRTIAGLRTRLFDHLQNLSLDFFGSAKTGELISRIINDTQLLYQIVANSLSSMIRDPITVVVLLGVMLTQQPTLTLISVIVLPACVVPIQIWNRKARKSARLMQGHIAELSSHMHESFTGNRIIKAYNLEEKSLGQFITTLKKYVSQQMRIIRTNELPSQLTEFLGAVGVALVLLHVAFYTDRSKTSAGDFLAFILGIVVMYQPIKSLTRLYNQLHQAAAASEHVFSLLGMQSTILDPARPVPLHAAGADIVFEDIDFKYAEKLILRDIEVTVKAGQMVALVGSSGSGKTTLTNLLLRFYDPQEGSVRIGGTDIRQVAIKDLRRQIALVTQETILFNDTIRNNILIGRPGASDAEVEAAARHAYAHDFIMEKAGGYNATIGERGSLLSVGQRQRITIARAILKNAPILVLDEATSALDSESERAVQTALEELMRGRTTICIAHRLSTIQEADLILVLDGGKVVESGTHTELLERRGVYHKLHELQKRGLDSGN